jgi:hypothetical protein
MVCDVVIAGAGPNGLMPACELRLAGVHPVVLERLSEPSPVNRANGLVGQVVHVTARTRDTAATGLLLRPDCYIAWATDTPHPGPDERESLHTMLSTWFDAAEQLPRSRPDPSHSGSPRVGGDQVQS